MKKLIGLLLAVLYFMSANASFALSELYYIKNVQRNDMAAKFETVIPTEKYTVEKKNPFYAYSNENAAEYLVAVFEQSGSNLFYYYDANNNDKKTNKAFLKLLKAQGITYEQSVNPDLLANFADIAQRTVSGTKKVYSFDEPQIEPVATTKQEAQVNSPTKLQGYVGLVGKGSVLPVYLQSAINTATAQKGDSVVGILKEDWIVNGRYVLAEAGSVLYGTMDAASAAQIGMRNGVVKFSFNKLVTPSGKTYNISTEKIDFKVTDEGRVQKVVTGVATSALVGAAVGALLGLIFSGGKGETVARSAVIGAGVSGGYNLIQDGMERGIDAEIPAYTDIEVVIKSDVNAVLSY